MTAETPLEMARRHVVEGEAAVEKQKRIVAELERDGHDATKAAEMLKSL